MNNETSNGDHTQNKSQDVRTNINYTSRSDTISHQHNNILEVRLYNSFGGGAETLHLGSDFISHPALKYTYSQWKEHVVQGTVPAGETVPEIYVPDESINCCSNTSRS